MMVYYTDEDRKRAAQSRRINRRKRALIESPEDSRDIRNDMYKDLFGVSSEIPKVEKKPTLSEYNLPIDIKDILRESDDRSLNVKMEKAKQKFYRFSLIILGLAILLNLYNLSHSTSLSLLIMTLISTPLILGFAYISMTDDIKPNITPLHTRYDSYERTLADYKYWQRKRDIKHWNSLTGHAFEASCAALFRNIGFSALVSRQGGDGGVDIVLTSSTRKIAVQCKRYKKSVGPHVARDLWGTMQNLGFEEGCIITTSGFTKGVKDFVIGKKIYLIDLNDILRAVNEDSKISEGYLMRKLSQ